MNPEIEIEEMNIIITRMDDDLQALKMELENILSQYPKAYDLDRNIKFKSKKQKKYRYGR
ncbi:MAG: hypothetical protein ACTSYD_10620 [Candidatus Heimdallarchaeaceae archaeon]